MRIVKSLARKKLKKKVTLNFKVSPEEARSIRYKAKLFCGGNVTALARLAIKAFKPRARDLVKIRR